MDWNTTVYVGLVSLMLEYGITRCLISTRSLLGEGWNSERLNTLIDLTVVTRYACVHCLLSSKRNASGCKRAGRFRLQCKFLRLP